MNWLFFFFKQKTAYEMRISDWSSDVCSSDRPVTAAFLAANPTMTLPDGRSANPLAGLKAFQFLPPFLNVPNAVESGKTNDGDFSYSVRAAYEQIGRASGRERVCQYVWISVDAVYLKKKKRKNTTE